MCSRSDNTSLATPWVTLNTDALYPIVSVQYILYSITTVLLNCAILYENEWMYLHKLYL